MEEEALTSLKSLYQLDVYPAVLNPNGIGRISDDFIILNDVKCIPSLYETPTRMDITLISICTNGYGRIAINMQEYYIAPGTLVIAFPDQILQSLEISDDYQGVSISFSKSVADEIYSKLNVILPLFFYTKEYPCVNLEPGELDSLMDYYNMFWKKVKKEGAYYSKDIIQGLLVAMYYEIYSIYRNRIPRRTEGSKNRKDILFDQFMRLLSESYKKERSVYFYAEKLFLTPKHLSSVIKEVSGRTAGEWIDIFVIFEAKTLLKSTQKNIQEISDELNFANQSFFGKYFRHYTGMSPKEYRKG